ncbi:conserved protein of DIM6/NTAB family [Thioflavicoccus mobilis 8321]|uniref:Conserved protein of DIM6/NTAB family n=1 Tax=Thioflavicoccus mobilis 8321 TaxID=765912 RepID=L0GXV8_9GAMM|nr:flavin reductase family protein [Thioflavicoccus mobilis]AGA91588.1 conserved protein of DIM6/NTAB family [Thioflavicoccus mobilis 8321]
MSSATGNEIPTGLAMDAQAAVGAVYDLYDPPLWLVTATDGRVRGGLIATFVARASIVPDLPRMVAGIAKHHHTWGLIEASGGFALHLLYPDQLELVWRFGLESGHQADKFAGLATETTPSGQPRLPQALAWLDCRVETRTDTGDRTLYLAAVTAGGAAAETTPLTAGRLYRAAPPEHRATLERLYARDGEIDTEAIRLWRARRANP